MEINNDKIVNNLMATDSPHNAIQCSMSFEITMKNYVILLFQCKNKLNKMKKIKCKILEIQNCLSDIKLQAILYSKMLGFYVKMISNI